MMKIIDIAYKAAFLSAVLLFSFSIHAQTFRRGFSDEGVSSNLTKMSQVYYYINSLYLDTVNLNSTTDKAIVSIVKELDPHSLYIPAKDVKTMNEPLEGNFSGVGVEFAIIDDTLTVQSTIQGGPSEQVGIKAGDKIIKVNGESISKTGLTIERVHKYLRGPEGSKVIVDIARKGESQPLNFTITRAKIPMNSLDAAYEIRDGILYLKLSRFSATSYDEIKSAINRIKPTKGIILDLRDNGGGYLVTAIQIANEFLKKGQLILYTEGKAVPRMNEYANGAGSLQDLPVAVLIDESSASASEIVSGAIQDWDRGTIIGRRSFGKGLVQQLFNLNDGSQLRLTVARYHTPSGRVIQSPYTAGKAEDYYKAFYKRYLDGGDVFGKDTVSFPDSLKYSTLVKKRTVYGGGGIMPDIYMPQDTSFSSKYYISIIRKGLLTEFVNHYLDANRTELQKQFKTYDSFVKKFDPADFKINKGNGSKPVFDEFLEYTVSNGLKYTDEEIAVSGAKIHEYLKALVLRGLFDFNDYVRFLNENDKEVLKSVEILSD